MKGETRFATSLFEPLGLSVTEVSVPLDLKFPEWGDSNYVKLTLSGTILLNEALPQIYLLLPVMDEAKHYWVSDDEVRKLMRAVADWLATHPARDLITKRHLAHLRSMTEKMNFPVDGDKETADEKALRPVLASKALHALRATAVLNALQHVGAQRVIDMGCGEEALLQNLFADPIFSMIIGADVSSHALNVAEDRLKLRELGDRQKARIRLIQSSATYLDDRLRNFDARVPMEVIEHIDPER